MFLRLNDHVL